MSNIANVHTCKNKDIINLSSIRPSKFIISKQAEHDGCTAVRRATWRTHTLKTYKQVETAVGKGWMGGGLATPETSLRKPLNAPRKNGAQSR